jgi:hypothetical protein
MVLLPIEKKSMTCLWIFGTETIILSYEIERLSICIDDISLTPDGKIKLTTPAQLDYPDLSPQPIGHVEDGACAALEIGFVQHLEYSH